MVCEKRRFLKYKKYEKFSGKTAFDSLREYLESEKIGYKYAMETRPGVMDEE